MTWSGASAIAVAAAVLSVPLAARQERQGAEPPRFRVSVDVVRIDAVVTDRDGRIVADLAADDFEVLQDGKPQNVTFAQFVPVRTGAAAREPARTAQGPRADAPAVPALPPSPVKRESIQRTLAIVVDDLGLSWESMHYAKRALRRFIDRDIGPADLVAIVRTGGSIGGLQPFTTDRRLLYQTIDRLVWNGLSRSGVEPYEALNIWTTFDNGRGMPVSDPNDFAALDSARGKMLAGGSLGALNLAIQAARDLPGRKAVIFVSEGFKVFDVEDTRVREALDRAIDRAARAGVVVYSLDARGLQTAGLQAADNIKRPGSPRQTMEESVREKAQDRLSFNRDTQEALAYLAEQTGGFAVLNTNDLARGLERISDDVGDYYVIGYVPDEGTFAAKGKTPRYHRISVKVRRPGVRVRTRKEFLGVADPDEPSGPPAPAQQLVRAAISPFVETDIELRATTLPGFSPERGLFLRALLHIDARALALSEGQDGKRTASADVLGMAFDRDGTQVAHLSTGFSIGLADETAADAAPDGLAYTLRIPIRRAGAYQVRFAVRDRNSGRVGSAGEFVEVADVTGGEFALSGIVLRSEGVADDDQRTAEAAQGSEAVAVPAEQALRTYRAGAGLTYAYEVYNAGPEVQAAPSVWRGTERILAAPPDTLVPPAADPRRFAARGRLKLGDALPAGGYVLQISAATPDSKRKGRLRTAVQRIAFEVR